MTLYAYALLPTLSLPLDLPSGIAGSLELATVGAIATLVERDLDFGVIEQDESALVQAVIAHDRVICQTFAQTPLLPLRFGTRFVSLSSLSDHLTTQQAVYLERLGALGGQGEFTFVLSPRPAPVSESATSPPTSGRAYFLAKKEALLAQQAFEEDQARQKEALLGAIAQAFPQHQIQEGNEDREDKVFVLADRRLATGEWLTAWEVAYPTWAIACTGPLPPYHFVS